MGRLGQMIADSPERVTRGMEPWELDMAKRYITRSIAEGRTTIALPVDDTQARRILNRHSAAFVSKETWFRQKLKEFGGMHLDGFSRAELTAWVISEREDFSAGTVRAYLYSASADGLVERCGTRDTGYRKPETLWKTTNRP